jgi:hypothetical protein
MLYLFEDKTAIVPIPSFPVGIKASSTIVDKGIRSLKTANAVQKSLRLTQEFTDKTMLFSGFTITRSLT